MLPAGAATLAATRADGVIHWAAAPEGDEVLTGVAESLAALLLAWGNRPLVAHDWKTISRDTAPSLDDEGLTPENLEHDTMIAAYLVDAARRQYPLDELLEQEGIEAVVEGADGVARDAVAIRALAAAQRPELERLELQTLFEDVELPLVAGALPDGAPGREARRRAAGAARGHGGGRGGPARAGHL